MKLRSILGVSLLMACCVGGAADTGCNQPPKTVVSEAISFEKQACVWLEAGEPLPVIKATCQILDIADVVVQSVVDDFFAHQAVLATYVPRYEAKKAEGKAKPIESYQRAHGP